MFKKGSRTNHVNCTGCVGFFNVGGGGKYSNHSTLKVTHLTVQYSCSKTNQMHQILKIYFTLE